MFLRRILIPRKAEAKIQIICMPKVAVRTRTSGKDCKKGKNRSEVTKIAKTKSQFCLRSFILLVTVAKRMAKYKINKNQIPVPMPESTVLVPLTSSVISMQNQIKLGVCGEFTSIVNGLAAGTEECLGH